MSVIIDSPGSGSYSGWVISYDTAEWHFRSRVTANLYFDNLPFFLKLLILNNYSPWTTPTNFSHTLILEELILIALY